MIRRLLTLVLTLLFTLHCAPCIVHCEPCIPHCASCIVNRAPSIVPDGLEVGVRYAVRPLDRHDVTCLREVLCSQQPLSVCEDYLRRLQFYLRNGDVTVGMTDSLRQLLTRHAPAGKVLDETMHVLDLYGALALGRQVPDVTLLDTLGGAHRLSELRGRLLVVDVWATWCSSCLHHLPEYEQLRQRYSHDSRVRLITVNIDVEAKRDLSLMTLQRLGVAANDAYLAPEATTDFCARLGVSSAPRYLVIGAEGEVVSSFAPHDAAGLDSLIRRELHHMEQAEWQRYRLDYLRSDSLPALSSDSLRAAQPILWPLPDSLEHDAVMPLLSGYKGAPLPADTVLFAADTVFLSADTALLPALLFLHGSGPRDRELQACHQWALRFDDAPSYYVIPQIPREDHYRWWQQSKQWAWERLLRRLLASTHIDPARLYLLGISEGGYGSQRLASFYADYLGAAGPMAGGEPLRNAPVENLSHLPLSFITGQNDQMFYRNLLTYRTGVALDSLSALYPSEYPHRIGLEPDHSHHVSYWLTTPWLVQHRRTAQPRHFRWENFDMDGRRRNAFYCLEVLREASDTLRTDYEFTVTGDSLIDLQIRLVDYHITERDPQFGIELQRTRTYRPAPSGKLRLYLSDQLVDLHRPITVRINGQLLYSGYPPCSTAILRQAFRLFGDPLRPFPACLDLDY